MQLFLGTVVQTTADAQLHILENTLLGVACDGKIAFVEPCTNAEELGRLAERFTFDSSAVQRLSPFQFLMPGLIDCHAHAPQYPNCGIGLELPLLDWLEKYTFPEEVKFADIQYARAEYEKCVSRMLQNGTTTCSYFASLHTPASVELARICHTRGQRAFVGKVNMDSGYCPPYYVEASADASLQDTLEFVEAVRSFAPLVRAAITPRFAPSCTPALMIALAEIARERQLLIQSHIGENRAEVAWVHELFPHCDDYAGVYANHGLLNANTILAHGVWLTDEELVKLKAANTAIIHCPNSNFTLRSGVCKVRRLLNAGIKVGLGTDISGGVAPSILIAMRCAMHASVACSTLATTPSEAAERIMSVDEALYLATQGGARALGIEGVTGNLVPGLEFDALLVDVHAAHGPIEPRPHDTLLNRVHRFLSTGDDRNILKVFVAGKCVVGG